MYSLENIFDQSIEDRTIIHNKLTNKEVIINYGYKIQKFSHTIEILNCSKGGDYFKGCTPDEYHNFYKYGWKKGCLLNNIENCKRKLNMIEDKMRVEVNTRKNDKYIQHLKTRREIILNKYTNLKTKLNGKEHF